jgi:hypothetical protein
VNKPAPERKVSVGDFAEKHRPEGKASKLLPFQQEIEELIDSELFADADPRIPQGEWSFNFTSRSLEISEEEPDIDIA